jgi:DNA-directed RNA polymerase subunit RPC12/RpoP
MKLHELSKDGALDMLERIRNTLWPPGREDTSWSADTLQNVAAAFGDYGLDSENVAPKKPEPAPIRCPTCGSRDFVRVVGGIELVTECGFDEVRREIQLRLDREEQREPHDGADYYRRYCCGRCDAELPQEIMDRINDEEYQEVCEA